jgi:hypothetical protein
MTSQTIFDTLKLPRESIVDQRIAKRLLVENGARTAADKRAIEEGVDEIVWKAVLKSATSGIPAYRDDTREYLEIAVLSLALREGYYIKDSRAARVIELIHRAIPYPVFLIARDSNDFEISTASKRWAQNEAGRMVLDKAPFRSSVVETTWMEEFFVSLAFSRQERRDFSTLYASWQMKLLLNEIAKITGHFPSSIDLSREPELRTTLAEYWRLTGVLEQLRESTRTETQINQRVELNLEIKRSVEELRLIQANLSAETQLPGVTHG